MDGQLDGIPLNSNLRKIRNSVTSVNMSEHVYFLSVIISRMPFKLIVN